MNIDNIKKCNMNRYIGTVLGTVVAIGDRLHLRISNLLKRFNERW